MKPIRTSLAGYDLEIPVEFWDDNKYDDKGGLNAIQCIELWRMLGRADPAPERAEVMIDKQDLDRWIRKWKKDARRH